MHEDNDKMKSERQSRLDAILDIATGGEISDERLDYALGVFDVKINSPIVEANLKEDGELLPYEQYVDEVRSWGNYLLFIDLYGSINETNKLLKIFETERTG